MKNYLILATIILISVLLRGFLLGQIPIGINWDEASLGYNAYSILLTGRDEYGKFFPITIRSFGDYKPALYMYGTIPFVYLFGLTSLSVRMLSFISGIVTILALYFLIAELFKNGIKIGNKSIRSGTIGLVSSFMLAISPWHIQFSRVAFESNLGLGLNILGLLFFLKGLNKNYFLIFSAIFFALSTYSYQSNKLFVPLMFFALLIIYKDIIFKINLKYLVVSIVVGVLILLPMFIYHITDPNAFARASGVSVFSQKTYLIEDTARRFAVDKNEGDLLGIIFNNRRLEYSKLVVSNYLSHFNPVWLFLESDTSPRHHAPNMGNLYLFEFPLILIGIYQLVYLKNYSRSKQVIFAWFILAALPAALTAGVPHSVRALNLVPIFHIFSALGLITIFIYLGRIKNKVLYFSVISLLIMIMFFNIAYYINQYFRYTNFYTSFEWRYGYKELVDFIEENKNSHNKIIVSNSDGMDQSYIFYLFYSGYNPEDYQMQKNKNFDSMEKRVDNIVFTNINVYKPEDDSLVISESKNFDSNITPLKRIRQINGTDYIWVIKK